MVSTFSLPRLVFGNSFIPLKLAIYMFANIYVMLSTLISNTSNNMFLQ